jgi:hypothetical protein
MAATPPQNNLLPAPAQELKIIVYECNVVREVRRSELIFVPFCLLEAQGIFEEPIRYLAQCALYSDKLSPIG